MLARDGVQPPAFGTAGILVAIIIFSVIPYSSHIVSADASLAVELIPSAQEANPGESAEYTVRVYNQGSEAATVSLSATNDQDCTGYSSSIGQISGPIEGGSYEETTLTVTLSQNAEGRVTPSSPPRAMSNHHLHLLGRLKRPLQPRLEMVLEVRSLAWISPWTHQWNKLGMELKNK